MSYASFEDVADRLGRTLSTSEESWVQYLLDDIEKAIQVRIPDLTDRVQADPPTIAMSTVVRVEAWAVVRYVKNPDGKFQESIDDYSFTRDKAVSSGILGLTDADWDELLPSAESSSAFTIRTVAEPYRASRPRFIGPDGWWT